MKDIILAMHVSLDGYVAGPNGEMDWIRFDDVMFDHVGKLTDEADTALYGRVTYQMMESYWPTAAEQPNATKHDIEHANWVNKALKLVVSNSLTSTNWENTKFISGDLNHSIQKEKQQPGKNILMIGSPSTVHQFTREGLIDRYWLFVNPVILGTGIPFFKETQHKVNLQLLESKTFANGVVGLHYKKQP